MQHTYPEHTYQPTTYTPIKSPVPAHHLWRWTCRYNYTVARSANEKAWVTRQLFDEVAAKACYHCFTCPAGFVVRKDIAKVAMPDNVLPACSTCRTLHMNNKLAGDKFTRPRRKERSLAVTVIE